MQFNTSYLLLATLTINGKELAFSLNFGED